MKTSRFVSRALAILAMLALGLTVLSVSSCKRKGSEIPVTGVTVSQPALTLTEGGTATISYTVEPSDASVKDVTFSSSDTGVATVDESGRVTAVGPGTATITVSTKDGGFKATVTVTVTAKDTPPGPPEPPTPGDSEVTGITLDKTTITLKVGEGIRHGRRLGHHHRHIQEQSQGQRQVRRDRGQQGHSRHGHNAQQDHP